jgi:Mg2+-importing ATPase
LSVVLGFLNEFRSERAVESLHSQIRSTALVMHGGVAKQVNVVDLVPGDVVRLRIGDIVPADVRLLEANALECDSRS